MRIVVTGGTRSGKSAMAESLLPVSGSVTYVATADDAVTDVEMGERIRRHRQARPGSWRTVETVAVGQAIAAAAGPVLVDSVGFWVAGRMAALELWQDGDLSVLVEEATSWFADPDRTVVVVAEQVGGGLVPPHRGSRRWVDAVGQVTAALSLAADRVVLCVAGRAVELPPPPPPPPPRLPDPPRPALADLPSPPLPGPARPAASPETREEAPHEEEPSEQAPDDVDALLGSHGDTMVPPDALDLAVNVVDQSPPPHIARALDAVVGRYPDMAPALVAVSALTGLTPDHVVLLAGAAEAFWLLPHALRPRHAAVIHPTFTAPEAALRACSIPVTRVAREESDGWRLRPERVPEDADMVVLGNPNNPTGTLDDPADIAGLCRPGRTVVVDEAFMDFVVDGRSSLAGRVDLPGLVVIRSVSKLWSVPGLRAGWLVTAPERAARLRRHQQPWPVSGQAIAVIAAAADDDSWRIDTADGIARRRQAMVQRLADIDLVKVHDGAANFVLIEVDSGPAVHRALLARGIAVRPSTFPLLPSRFLRVTVRDAPAVEALAGALEAIL
ncbi:MAG TPA: bifunctional adenosylcobinamide kinase/adenosylcobinamide-phosphate guanylyltransferase [Euzebya sp.]|nr:bifunctional adenosylcobinamide kinase/adenosylcobinamide-phosphate guanylyltransferase [Euzebya sp.]